MFAPSLHRSQPVSNVDTSLIILSLWLVDAVGNV